MDIIKDRAVWIVLFLVILGGLSYMVVVDPDRVEKMDEIVVRDDTRVGDITEVKELYNRLDLKLNGTKQHLKNLYDTTVTHMKNYNAKIDSINNVFSRVEYSINELRKFIKSEFESLADDIEDLSDDISGLKTKQTKDTAAASAKTDYETAKNTYLSQTTLEEINSSRIIAQDKNQVMLDNQTIFTASLSLVGILWVGNAFEALLNFPDYGFSISANTNYYQNASNILSIEPTISLTYNF